MCVCVCVCVGGGGGHFVPLAAVVVVVFGLLEPLGVVVVVHYYVRMDGVNQGECAQLWVGGLCVRYPTDVVYCIVKKVYFVTLVGGLSDLFWPKVCDHLPGLC